MDKTIVDKAIGSGGLDVAVGVDGANLAVEIKFPLAKAVQPLNDIVDKAINAIEAAIPGDWDKALLEPIRAAAKAEVLALIGG